MFLILFSFISRDVFAQTISNINIGPTNLDISRFSPYYVTTEVTDYQSTIPPIIEISTINGYVGITNWNFFSDGVASSEILSFPMTYVSNNTWIKNNIYPDYIYPEIFFAPSVVTWNNTPSNTIIQRNSYQLFHFQNPFSMTDSMSFWIEFNAVAVAANSADLQVYLVSKNLDTFTSDWRNNDQVELVGNISVGTSVHHTHTVNSSHYLVSLSTNSDNTIGNKHLDISGDFWIILYNSSPNNSRGWNLRYQNVCTNASGRWLKGSQSGWATTTQTGCPDVHIHIARRSDIGGIKDAENFQITADNISESQTFYFNEIPNLPPNATNFITPVIGSGYSGIFSISWDPASDANGDELSYNITLQNSATGGDRSTSKWDHCHQLFF